ncbi:RxLR effector protein [Phytophthora megakarya]|uniref:RxLR effector protein n=1 Tax=Phytophthora megakarya TaxID=4795 RepID=A0A225V875_9STRA|nr:RxLR effector protein [Phytophthora megakarya]
MHFSHVIALVVVLLATLATVTAANSKLSRVRSIADDHKITPTIRSLRDESPQDEDSEEKTINLSGLTSKALKIDNIDSLKLEAKSGVAFNLLKLDDTIDNVFQKHNMKIWINYVKSLHQKNPEAVMISTLVAKYGDEDVVRMLEAAKKIDGMEEISTKLQSAQMTSWLNKQTSPEDVFYFLALDYRVENIFEGKNYDTWVSYLRLFNHQYPEQQTTTIKTLSTIYGDKDLSIALEKAKNSPTTVKLATELQIKQFNLWSLEGAPPAKIGEMLGGTAKTADRMTSESEIYYGYKKFYNLGHLVLF